MNHETFDDLTLPSHWQCTFSIAYALDMATHCHSIGCKKEARYWEDRAINMDNISRATGCKVVGVFGSERVIIGEVN